MRLRAEICTHYTSRFPSLLRTQDSLQEECTQQWGPPSWNLGFGSQSGCLLSLWVISSSIYAHNHLTLVFCSHTLTVPPPSYSAEHLNESLAPCNPSPSPPVWCTLGQPGSAQLRATNHTLGVLSDQSCFYLNLVLFPAQPFTHPDLMNLTKEATLHPP